MVPLSEPERRILIAAKLHQKQHRVGPPWRWLRQQSGLSRSKFQRTMLRLRQAGYLTFSREPGTTFCTPKGVRAALRTSGP
jgi:DNA-binding IclR family transcriptional regulator